jgi:hypothetical protein
LVGARGFAPLIFKIGENQDKDACSGENPVKDFLRFKRIIPLYSLFVTLLQWFSRSVLELTKKKYNAWVLGDGVA